MVGAARPQTAFRRMERELETLKTWASNFKLEFSAAKSQLLSLKGGLKPRYSVGFGIGADAPRISSTATAKYLGVLLDPRRSYWDHVVSCARNQNPCIIGLGHSTLRTGEWAEWLPGRYTEASSCQGSHTRPRSGPMARN
ncbi:unnamed protein product [Macrosiphum euphorbiae]|uniref:Reverse transcriptase n=1 Tax=Macrosiphum euphorbiae TaxID=13131 RepID=A0AAV0Y822_9HEMI|nr:unnamed protein product [Macrosiphum euphorbiae]